jgi:hypothetical protein
MVPAQVVLEQAVPDFPGFAAAAAGEVVVVQVGLCPAEVQHLQH